MKPLDSVMSHLQKHCQSGDFYILYKETRRRCGRAGAASTQTQEQITETSPQNQTSLEVMPESRAPGTDLSDLLQVFGATLITDEEYAPLSSSPSSTAASDSTHDSPVYRRIPDIICTKEEGYRAFLVGEVKVPWLHELTSFSQLHTQGDRFKDMQGLARAWLAQICEYMSDLKLKYGFLTTYEATVFLEFGTESGKQDGPLQVKCSPVVTWNGQPVRGGECFEGGFSEHNIYEAMFYMMSHCYSKRRSKYRTAHLRPVLRKGKSS